MKKPSRNRIGVVPRVAPFAILDPSTPAMGWSNAEGMALV